MSYKILTGVRDGALSQWQSCSGLLQELWFYLLYIKEPLGEILLAVLPFLINLKSGKAEGVK